MAVGCYYLIITLLLNLLELISVAVSNYSLIYIFCIFLIRKLLIFLTQAETQSFQIEIKSFVNIQKADCNSIDTIFLNICAEQKHSNACKILYASDVFDKSTENQEDFKIFRFTNASYHLPNLIVDVCCINNNYISELLVTMCLTRATIGTMLYMPIVIYGLLLKRFLKTCP